MRDLGRIQRDAIESQLERLLLHILTWQYQPQLKSSSWEISIKDARRQIKKLCRKYPVLIKHIHKEDVFDECYLDAREAAIDKTGLPKTTFSLEYPYSLEQVLNSSFFPEAIADE